MKKSVVGGLSAIVLLFSATGCLPLPGQDETAAPVKKGGPAKVTEGEPTETEEAAPEDEGDITASLGDTVSLPGWDVKVTEVNLNATAALKKAYEYTDAPKGQYVLVNYEATYTGTERTANAEYDLRWSMTGTDNQVRDSGFAMTPARLEDWPTETRSGGTVKNQVVFDVPADTIKGGLLSVEAYDDSYNKVFADFTVE